MAAILLNEYNCVSGPIVLSDLAVWVDGDIN